MCGLSGFVDLRDANGNGELLRGINRKLSHHGPDAEGYYEQGPARAGTSKSC
jgi:asparagine synthetase B (glutamine-hydrolysing)